MKDLADRSGISPHLRFPETMADHHGMRRAGAKLVGSESTAQRGLEIEERKKFARNPIGLQTRGLLETGKRHNGGRRYGQMIKRTAGPPPIAGKPQRDNFLCIAPG